jgi:hypothetical protein
VHDPAAGRSPYQTAARALTIRPMSDEEIEPIWFDNVPTFYRRAKPRGDQLPRRYVERDGVEYYVVDLGDDGLRRCSVSGHQTLEWVASIPGGDPPERNS